MGKNKKRLRKYQLMFRLLLITLSLFCLLPLYILYINMFILFLVLSSSHKNVLYRRLPNSSTLFSTYIWRLEGTIKIFSHFSLMVSFPVNYLRDINLILIVIFIWLRLRQYQWFYLFTETLRELSKCKLCK